MGNFLAELKRRHIYRVAAAYAVVAWVLIQLVSNVSPMLRLPDWAGTFVLVLLFVGFPVALLFAWIHQLASESGALAHVTTGKLDWFLAGALVVVIALVSYQQFAPTRATVTVNPQSEVEVARSAASSAAGVISIAVLPFTNLSGDTAQEFFSDGMTEEITAALAKVPDLRVVARTSAFQFTAQKRDIQSIGQQLHATHFIEGSVRKAGDRVRITAQLIKADDGTHIWAETYDRDLTDLFAIQEEIARAITASLRMPLGLKPGENLVNNRSIDPESYQQFLRAKAALLKAQGNFAEQLALLEPVVGKNPNYAPAWAALAQAYNFAAGNRLGTPEERADYRAKMLAAARRAVELDPDLVEAQVQYTRTISGPRRLALMEDALTHALAVDPNGPDALELYSNMLMALGRLKEAVALKQRSHELDPFIPVRNNNLAEALWLDGQTDAAIALLKDSVGQIRPGFGAEIDLARIYASMGRFEDAAQTLSLILRGQRPKQIQDSVSAAMQLLRSAPAKAADPKKLPRQGALNFIYLYVGMPERAFEAYEEGNRSFPEIAELWHRDYASVRKLERFKKVMREEGIVEYWRERGWPQWCHPVGADDFVCD